MGNANDHKLCRAWSMVGRVSKLFVCCPKQAPHPQEVFWAQKHYFAPKPAFSLDILLSRRDTDSLLRDHTRTPPDKAEMASTTILKVKIVNGSGKIRTGGPGDEKKDSERADLLQRVWTGVVPMWETVGEPVAGGEGRVEEVPEHVRAFRDDTNKVNEKYANSAAVEKV